MFCAYCGKQIPDDSRICPFCGIAVVGAEAPVEVATVVAPVEEPVVVPVAEPVVPVEEPVVVPVAEPVVPVEEPVVVPVAPVVPAQPEKKEKTPMPFDKKLWIVSLFTPAAMLATAIVSSIMGAIANAIYGALDYNYGVTSVISYIVGILGLTVLLGASFGLFIAFSRMLPEKDEWKKLFWMSALPVVALRISSTFNVSNIFNGLAFSTSISSGLASGLGALCNIAGALGFLALGYFATLLLFRKFVYKDQLAQSTEEAETTEE